MHRPGGQPDLDASPHGATGSNEEERSSRPLAFYCYYRPRRFQDGDDVDKSTECPYDNLATRCSPAVTGPLQGPSLSSSPLDTPTLVATQESTSPLEPKPSCHPFSSPDSPTSAVHSYSWRRSHLAVVVGWSLKRLKEFGRSFCWGRCPEVQADRCGYPMYNSYSRPRDMSQLASSWEEEIIRSYRLSSARRPPSSSSGGAASLTHYTLNWLHGRHV